MATERTLSIIKPDATKRNLTGKITAKFEDAGLRSTRDGAIQILQGRGVGGSTVHNLGTCLRAPNPILETWARAHGVRDLDQLADSFTRVEAGLGVSQLTREELNELNRRVERGSGLLGYRGKIAMHNRIGCVRSSTSPP